MYFEEESKRNSKQNLAQKRKKQKQATMLIALLIVGGLAYYFLSYLPDEKIRAKEEIEEMLKDNWNVTVDKLDKSLWEGSENWEEYLEGLFLPSQVQGFKERMLGDIERKIEESEEEEKDRPRKEREKAVKEVEALLDEKEKQMPDIQKTMEEFKKKINSTPVNDLSSVIEETRKFIFENRDKRQGLHWKRPTHNWADRKLAESKDKLNNAWALKESAVREGKEPERASFNASYTIKFPSSLWNELSEEEKKHEKASELTLRDDVHTYKFNDKIDEWYDKVKSDPIRGEKDYNTKKDNNALFYGTGGTGKSISVEKLAYEADVYPLVVIQGSSLTPKITDQKHDIAAFEKFIYTVSDITWTLTDYFNFEREEDGEVRYILFIDEADQVCLNSMDSKSTGLTFLKECMGSDDYKKNESWNLWIMATNHLKEIDPAVYRPGRLSNPLDFSWTLGDFIRYADDAGISSQFPEHWTKEKTLSDEDNKWVNRFNKMYFDADFLPFWNTFISSNPNCEYEPEKDTDQNNQQSNTNQPKKVKIKWGEFLEFFWNLKDSSQLEHFEGKFANPRQPKIEQVVEESAKTIANKISIDISKAIETKLNELNQTARNTNTTIQNSQTNMTNTISQKLEEIKGRLTELGGSRSSSYY